MNLRARIERIKGAFSYVNLVRMIALETGVDLPDPPSRLIRCPLPGHSEKTGSFHLREAGFFCFGCRRGGDAVDLMAQLEGLELPDAVDRMEALLGMGSHEEGLLALAKRREHVLTDDERLAMGWFEALASLEADFLKRTGPYERSRDPIVYGLTTARVQWVVDEFSLLRLRPHKHQDDALAYAFTPPVTTRGQREKLRSMRVWCEGMAAGIERDVQRTTGHDLLDVWAADYRAHLGKKGIAAAKVILGKVKGVKPRGKHLLIVFLDLLARTPGPERRAFVRSFLTMLRDQMRPVRTKCVP